MRNGSVSPAGTLVAPLLDEGCYWLESPGALSSTGNGRPPGQSKLEAQLRKIGAIAQQEVVNPIFLEGAFAIPEEWSNPSEQRPATQLLEGAEKRSVIASTPELQRSHSNESSTSTRLHPNQWKVGDHCFAWYECGDIKEWRSGKISRVDQDGAYIDFDRVKLKDTTIQGSGWKPFKEIRETAPHSNESSTSTPSFDFHINQRVVCSWGSQGSVVELKEGRARVNFDDAPGADGVWVDLSSLQQKEESSVTWLPSILLVDDRLETWQLPDIEACEVTGETPKKVKTTNSQGERIQEFKDKVWYLPKREYWMQFSELHQRYQKALDLLWLTLESLGDYQAELEKAGGVKKAPNPLSPEVINVEVPNHTWETPHLRRQTILRHTNQMLRTANDWGEGAMSQVGCVLLPSEADWEEVRSLHEEAVRLQGLVEEFLNFLGTYDKAEVKWAKPKEYLKSLGDDYFQRFKEDETHRNSAQAPTAAENVGTPCSSSPIESLPAEDDTRDSAKPAQNPEAAGDIRFEVGEKVQHRSYPDGEGPQGVVVGIKRSQVESRFDEVTVKWLPDGHVSPMLAELLKKGLAKGPELTSGVSISFGKTLEQLVNNNKSVTRRLWSDRYAALFIKCYEQGKKVQALDKDRRYGGKQIGWLTLTCKPYQERLIDMPPEDLACEGFADYSLQEFIDEFFNGIAETTVWVVRFEFEPFPPSSEKEVSSNSQIFEPGDCVSHPNLGQGIVVSIDEPGTLWLEFEDAEPITASFPLVLWESGEHRAIRANTLKFLGKGTIPSPDSRIGHLRGVLDEIAHRTGGYWAKKRKQIGLQIQSLLTALPPQLSVVVRQPNRPEVEGEVMFDLGSELLIETGDEALVSPKLYAYPKESITAPAEKPTARLHSRRRQGVFEVLRVEGTDALLVIPEYDIPQRYPLHDIELNDAAIALLSVEQLDAVIKLNHEACEEKFAEAQRSLNAALLRAKQTGQMLLVRKRSLGHGAWLPWLEGQGIKERSAQVYARIAKEWSSIIKSAEAAGLNLETLTIERALKLIAKSKEPLALPEPEVLEGELINSTPVRPREEDEPHAITGEEILTELAIGIKSLPPDDLGALLETVNPTLSPRQSTRLIKVAAAVAPRALGEWEDEELIELANNAKALMQQAKRLLNERKNPQYFRKP